MPRPDTPGGNVGRCQVEIGEVLLAGVDVDFSLSHEFGGSDHPTRSVREFRGNGEAFAKAEAANGHPALLVDCEGYSSGHGAIMAPAAIRGNRQMPYLAIR